MSVLDELTVFYFAWVGSSQKTKYLGPYKQLTSTLTTMQQASLNGIIQQLKKNNSTDQGKSRKQRIGEKLFFKKKATLCPFLLNSYVASLIQRLPVYDNDTRIQKLWGQELQKYPALKTVVTPALSIFTRIEQSFSMMNSVVTKTSNRLNVTTFSTIQTKI